MLHLGDITKISGYDAPMVDCIIGGSPCQDLSVAGKRAGLAGERSGLFMEQIRIVKEMRARGGTNDAVRPRYMVWENVPGAFSSNGGKDFAAVLEETIRVIEPEAPSVPVPEKGWPTSGCFMGDKWSVAWRVLDAQFWGVPQRRRRIALIADFGGHSAPEICFVRKSLSGNLEPGEQKGKETAGGVGGGSAESSLFQPKSIMEENWQRSDVKNAIRAEESKTTHAILQPVAYGSDQKGGKGSTNYAADVMPTICGDSHGTPHAVAYSVENHPADSRVDINPTGKVQTLASRMGTGGGNVPKVMSIGNGKTNQSCTEGIAGALNCMHDQQAVFCRNIAHTLKAKASCDFREDSETYPIQNHVARRLTPLECERLQGYPDGWTDIGEWVDYKGKLHKSADSPRYKALGSSIAIPPWKWLLKRLCACYERDATMASLFDGIGGFPLIWEQLNGKGSCLWASEIEEFPMAVTKVRFGE